jgi:gamma-glutamyltranspeptidase / glutathione hydrolase
MRPGAVGIAGPSEIAVQAGAAVAAAGGNAVDAAVAATLAALATEIGIVGLDAGAYVTLWPPGGEPVVIDGGIAMPGLGRAPERFGAAARHVRVDYGGGVRTIVGYGSVGVGGAVAALGEAAGRWSRLEWPQLTAPAERRVRAGFPLRSASHTWLQYSHRAIFGWQRESAAVIHDADGALLPPGAILRVPGLGDTFAELGRDGPESMYSGRLGAEIAACIEAGGGLLGMTDRRVYRAQLHEPLRCSLDGWSVALPPPPAIGGAALAAMLSRLQDQPAGEWTAQSVGALARAQRDVFEFLRDLPVDGATDEFLGSLLAWAEGGGERVAHRSPSTIHVSTLDHEGLACAVTASSGYGSGILVPGTGIWLNNCLGEMELNPGGFHGLAPGVRMGSNMAPVAARTATGEVLSLGSPGAERITTALLQVMLNFMRLGRSLEPALVAPRLHVEADGEAWRAAVEPGLPTESIDMPLRVFDGLSMFFGGAGAVLRDASGVLTAAADPRRQGAAMVVRG